jgi:hypothetical protein
VTVRKSLEKQDRAVAGPLPASGQALARPVAVPPVVLTWQARLAVREEAGASRHRRSSEARAAVAATRGQCR